MAAMQTASSLETLPLSPLELDACRKADILDISGIISKTTQQLKSLKGLADDESASRIRYAACAIQAPKSNSLADLIASEEEIESSCRSTGDSEIDNLLGGGLHENVLTEITGRFATGKTQILLQSAIFTTLGLHTSLEKRNLEELQGAKDEKELCNALRGIGIHSPHKRRSVILITFDGEAEHSILVRRMKQMCDSLIEQRYLLAEKEMREKVRAAKVGSHVKRKGAFISSDQRTFTLREAQAMAQRQLLRNLYLDCPISYLMLTQLTFTQKLPDIINTLSGDQSRAPLGLIILDDLTRVIHEGAGFISDKFNNNATIARSYICCEISDNLKRFAIKTKSAVLVINHVIDTQDRHKSFIRPCIESVVNGVPTTQIHDQFTAKGQNEALSLAFQEVQYGGVMAHVNERNFIAPSAESIESVMSETQMASLGLSWVNSINVRIVLSMTSQKVSLPREQQFRLGYSNLSKKHTFGVRRAVSVLNPFAVTDGQNAVVEFIICPSGVHSLKTMNIKSEENESPAAQVDEEEQLWNSFGGDREQEEADWFAFAQTQEMQSVHLNNTNSSQDELM